MWIRNLEDPRFWYCFADDDGGDDGGGGGGGGSTGDDDGGDDGGATDTSGANTGGAGDTGQSDGQGTAGGDQTGGGDQSAPGAAGGQAGGGGDVGGDQTAPGGDQTSPGGDQTGGPSGDITAAGDVSSALDTAGQGGPAAAAGAAGLGGGLSSASDVLAGTGGPVSAALGGDGLIGGNTLGPGATNANPASNLPGADSPATPTTPTTDDQLNTALGLPSTVSGTQVYDPSTLNPLDQQLLTNEENAPPGLLPSGDLAAGPSNIGLSPADALYAAGPALSGGLPASGSTINSTNPNAAPDSFQPAAPAVVADNNPATATIAGQAAATFPANSDPFGTATVAPATPQKGDFQGVTTTPDGNLTTGNAYLSANANEFSGLGLPSTNPDNTPAAPAGPTQVAGPAAPGSTQPDSNTISTQSNVAAALQGGADSAGFTAPADGGAGASGAASIGLTPQQLLAPISSDGVTTPTADGGGVIPSGFTVAGFGGDPNFNPEAGIFGPTYPGGAVPPALPGGVSGPQGILVGGNPDDQIAPGNFGLSDEGMFALNNATDTGADGANFNPNEGIT